MMLYQSRCNHLAAVTAMTWTVDTDMRLIQPLDWTCCHDDICDSLEPVGACGVHKV